MLEQQTAWLAEVDVWLRERDVRRQWSHCRHGCRKRYLQTPLDKVFTNEDNAPLHPTGTNVLYAIQS